MVLWRGMRDMTVDIEKFMVEGGSEFAPMSTTREKDVALSYAQSRCPLVFKYVTAGMERGSPLEYLSMYPGELLPS